MNRSEIKEQKPESNNEEWKMRKSLIFHSWFARHGRALMGESPEHA